MAFLDSLVRGFIRSAVNQVGKDGGKLISNKLYKGGHSTPIANVGDESYNRQRYQDASPLPTSSSVVFNALMFALWTLILPNAFIHQLGKMAFFIPVLFIRRLWKPLFSSYVHPKVSRNLYKSDRRFTTGRKVVGSYSTTDTSIRVPLEENEIRLLRIEGIVKLFIVIISYGAMYYTSRTPDFVLTQMDTQEKTRRIQPGDTLYKKEKFIYYYQRTGKKEAHYEQTAFDTTGVNVILLAIDSIQTNTDNRVGMQKVKGSPEFQSFTPTFMVMYKVDPLLKPIPKFSGKKHKNRNPGDWYLRPEDVHVGQGKLIEK